MITRIHPMVTALSKDTGYSNEECLQALELKDWDYFSAKCYLLEKYG